MGGNSPQTVTNAGGVLGPTPTTWGGVPHPLAKPGVTGTTSGVPVAHYPGMLPGMGGAMGHSPMLGNGGSMGPMPGTGGTMGNPAAGTKTVLPTPSTGGDMPLP